MDGEDVAQFIRGGDLGSVEQEIKEEEILNTTSGG